jgi:hypothetical protein
MGMAMPHPVVANGAGVHVDEHHLPDWHYVNNGESFADGVNNYFTAWLDMPGPNGTTHRHVVCRLIVPLDVAKRLRDQATKEWTKGGH